MKKIISIIIGLLIITPLAIASYETAEKATVLSYNSVTRNVVVEKDESMWLLRYNGNCDQITVGKDVTLATAGELDGYSDYLKTSSYYKCEIEQAEEISGILHVDYVFNEKTQAGVTDEDGEKYVILVNSNCSKILGYMYKDIYYKGYQSQLAKGDYIFLPRNEGRCSLLYVDHVEKDVEDPEPIDADIDVTEPGTVSNVNAVPGDGKVYLNWDEASDNVAVDHYIVSYSEYSFDTTRYDVEDLPNQIVTEDTNITIEELKNENIYYFYVLAVDSSGNMSSRWSEEASAEPRSTIHETDTDYERPETEIEQVQVTSSSILFKWEKIQLYKRQTVILEVDGERDFSFTSWSKDYIRILKKDSRKGKELKLIVRQYDTYGGMYKDEFEFSF